MLYNGERIGDGRPPLVDIAVDPVDGTTLTRWPQRRAVGHCAVERVNVQPGPCVYMNKIAVDRAARFIDINASVTDNLSELSKRLKIPMPNSGVVILDRPRTKHCSRSSRDRCARALNLRRRRRWRHCDRLAEFRRGHSHWSRGTPRA